MDQGGPGNNGNEDVTAHTLKLQNGSLTTRFIVESLPKHWFFGWVLNSVLYIYIYTNTGNEFDNEVWCYTSHGAKYGVTASHSTCGCCVRDYHICFRQLLCHVLPCPRCIWKIHKRGLTQFRSSSDGQVIWVTRLSSNSKNRENLLLTYNKDNFYWSICEKINYKKTMLAFLAKRRKNIERGRVMMRCG